MKRSGPPQRRTRLRAINRQRRARLLVEQFGPQAELCRRLPCLVCGKTPSDPAHVRSRGAGGGDRDTVPLCRDCHQAQHRIGVEGFNSRHGLDLAAEAARLAAIVAKGLDT